MLEVYPEKVAKLSPDGFSRIVGTLDFGLHHQVHVCAVFTIPSCKVINTINRPIETMNESYVSWSIENPFLFAWSLRDERCLIYVFQHI
jgi:hypothetical protein